MAILAILMCVNFAACSNDDEEIDFNKTELMINGEHFMAYSWGCYDETNTKTDVCSTFVYEKSQYKDEKGRVIDCYDEYFNGGIEGELSNKIFCDIELFISGVEIGNNKKSFNAFKKGNVDLTQYSKYVAFSINTDNGNFSSYNSYKSGKIYLKSFTSNALTLSFESYTLTEANTSIILNGSICFKYSTARVNNPL